MEILVTTETDCVCIRLQTNVRGKRQKGYFLYQIIMFDKLMPPPPHTHDKNRITYVQPVQIVMTQGTAAEVILAALRSVGMARSFHESGCGYESRDGKFYFNII